jgi:hypothetical protein
MQPPQSAIGYALELQKQPATTTSAACPRGNLICSTNEQAFYRLSEAEVVVGVR